MVVTEYTIPWPDLPYHIRSKIITDTFDMVYINAKENLDAFDGYLQKHGAVYNDDNTITFKSKSHYTIFLLKFI